MISDTESVTNSLEIISSSFLKAISPELESEITNNTITKDTLLQ